MAADATIVDRLLTWLKPEVHPSQAQQDKLVDAVVTEATAVSDNIKFNQISQGVGMVGGMISGIADMYFKGEMMDLQRDVFTAQRALANKVADHRIRLEDEVVEKQTEIALKKLDVDKDLAHTAKDLQIELAKIKSDTQVRIAGKQATTNLFLQRNYGHPAVAVAV